MSAAFLLVENPATGDLDQSPLRSGAVEEGPDLPPGDGVKTCRTCRRNLPLRCFPRAMGRVPCRRGTCWTCWRLRKAWHSRAYRDRQWALDYRHRSKKAGHLPVVEFFTREDVIAAYGDACVHCEVGEFEQLDHYPVAVADGGHHTLENVRPSCGDCNRRGGLEVRRRRAAAKKEASC